MTKPKAKADDKPISLKSAAQRRAMVGQTLNEVLALASKQGYAMTVLYGKDVKLRSEGPKTLVVHATEDGKVIAVR